jgi:uncharacterized protein YigA (DUF484 family)
MSKQFGKNSSEEFVISYLKKNKNFFIKYPELINLINFPFNNKGSNKVIDLDAYRYKKISQENIDLQNQMTEILLAGKSHMNNQKRILRSSIKILNSKTIDKVINVILADLKTLLNCDFINCFSTNESINIHDVHKIDARIVKSYFKDKSVTNLNQNPKGILLYFPNKSKIVKSYILLKINMGEKLLIIAMGSKDNKKFTPDQQVDLVEYLIKIIEIKLYNIL